MSIKTALAQIQIKTEKKIKDSWDFKSTGRFKIKGIVFIKRYINIMIKVKKPNKPVSPSVLR